MDNPALDVARIPVTPDGRVNRADAARYLGYEKRTLEEWHRLGKGPPSLMVGGRRFYRLHDLQAFVAGGTVAAAA